MLSLSGWRQGWQWGSENRYLGGLENTLHKRIAILAVAVSWFFAAHLPIVAASPAGEGGKSTTTSGTSVSASSPKPRASVATTKKRVRRRRVRRYRSPWSVSSFGNPTAEDDPTGEDPMVREAAVEALGNWNGTIVVVEPNTGRILSIVNQKLALSSGFTPCSTFKPVVALAALNEGLITPDTRIRVWRRARMNLTQALAKSNNTFFAYLGRQLGFERVALYARLFGLGEKAGLDIPGEYPGVFPTEPPKEGGVGLLTSFGTDIEITPLQLAAIISAVANGGTLYYLQYPRTPEEIARFEPKPRRELRVLTDHIPKIRKGLAAAVLYGTAQSAFDSEEQILGKTGTCSEDGARLGWFASYSSDSQPKYAVVVLLRGGKQMYGPHAAEIAGQVYRGLRLREEEASQAGDLGSDLGDDSP
jgi:penicillin-binding protein 2